MMTNDEKIRELEKRCPGCSFAVEDTSDEAVIRITEYGRGFIVKKEWADLPGEWPECWFDYEIGRRPLAEVPPLEPDEKYRVICRIHGPVVIGYGNYRDQLARPDMGWYCPRCGSDATFDDEAYETYSEELDEKEETSQRQGIQTGQAG